MWGQHDIREIVKAGPRTRVGLGHFGFEHIEAGAPNATLTQGSLIFTMGSSYSCELEALDRLPVGAQTSKPRHNDGLAARLSPRYTTGPALGHQAIEQLAGASRPLAT